MLVLFLLGTLLWHPAVAENATERLEQEIQEAEQRLEERRAEIQAIDRELAASRAELDRRLAELEATSQRLAALRQERQGLLAQIAALERDIAATLARLEAEQAEFARLQERVQRLILNLYYGRPNRNLRVLVKAESLFDLRVRNHYLSLMTAQDVDLLRALEATLARLAAEEERLVSERSALAVRERELEANERALAESEAQVRQAVGALEQTREGQLALRRQALEAEETVASALARSQRELEAERERLRIEAELARQRAEEAERERLRLEEEARQAQAQAQAARDADARDADAAREAAIRAAAERNRARAEVQDTKQALQRLQVPIQQAESDYRLPLDNARLFSRFSASTGADWLGLQAEQAGAPVRAAKSGLIILATRISANTGYLVTIQHEPQRCTSYRNLQGPPPVSRGSQVAQGEVIGYLGGGALVRPDVLHFFVNGGANCTTNLDPAPHLGIR